MEFAPRSHLLHGIVFSSLAIECLSDQAAFVTRAPAEMKNKDIFETTFTVPGTFFTALTALRCYKLHSDNRSTNTRCGGIDAHSGVTVDRAEVLPAKEAEPPAGFAEMKSGC
jgi:hypothetical protein